MKLHPGEVDIDAALVEALVREQFPRLLGPVREVRSTGTVNAIYRLGERHYVRLPRLAHWVTDLEMEWTWLPRLAPRVSLRVPVPVALGEPTEAYPFRWAVYEWIEGAPYDGEDELGRRGGARGVRGRAAGDRAASRCPARRPATARRAGGRDPRGALRGVLWRRGSARSTRRSGMARSQSGSTPTCCGRTSWSTVAACGR